MSRACPGWSRSTSTKRYDSPRCSHLTAMWDLRWVLLGLGALLVVGVYLWTKGLGGRRLFPDTSRRARAEPSIGEPTGVAKHEPTSAPSTEVAAEPKPRRPAHGPT